MKGLCIDCFRGDKLRAYALTVLGVTSEGLMQGDKLRAYALTVLGVTSEGLMH